MNTLNRAEKSSGKQGKPVIYARDLSEQGYGRFAIADPFGYFLKPRTSEAIKSTMKIMKSTLAIHAAVPAIPAKPRTAAMIAIIRNMSVHESIYLPFSGLAVYI